jgi:hypothetical protein
MINNPFRDAHILNRYFWFGQIDSRAISVFRILFGLQLLKDALYHVPLARIFYSDAGIFPRDVLLEMARPTHFSLLESFGHDWMVMLFFGAWIGILVCLIFGYRTRAMTILNFLFILSIHERNIFVLNGADTVMRVLSFWIIFLPLGQHFSIDQWRNPTQSRTAFSFPLRIIQLQIALVYLMTGILKLPGDLWQSGDALFYTLQLERLTHFTGDIFLELSPLLLLQILTHFALIAELLFLFLVFAPIFQPRLKAIALISVVMLHLGIGVLMSVPNFSIVMIISYLLFFPAEWVDYLARRFHRLRWLTRGGDETPIAAPSRYRRVLLVLIPGFMMFNVIGWNLSNSHLFGSQQSELQRHLVLYSGLWQSWDMFAPNPSRTDGWLMVIGRFEDGGMLNLRSGEDDYQNQIRYFFGPQVRWQKFDENMFNRANMDLIYSAWGGYYCRTYNNLGQLPEGQRLATMEFIYYSRLSHAPGESAYNIQPNLKWKQWCYEQYAY